MKSPMNDFDRLLNAIRNESVEVGEAGSRVHAKLELEMGESVEVARLDSCADFRALLPAYRANNLSEARRMLVEDHLHSCVACRQVFSPRSKVVSITAKRPMRMIPWAIAAAAAVVVGVVTLPSLFDRVLTPSGPRATVASVDGQLYKISAQGATPLAAGAAIAENEEIRTDKGSRAIVQLRDGSRVEMAERSDLTLSERWSGKTVHLARGAVMIEAAKQRRGRLEVATGDCLVSVKGTIFEVSRGTKGSRVSVVEGEVKVDQEGDSSLLHRGDQKATNNSMANTSVAEDVAWSANAAKYMALLGELSAIQKRIEQIPGPGLRYQSKLAGLLPEDTMVYAAIPNLGPTLAEATSIFEERVQQSAVLREWWNEKNAKQIQFIVNQVRTFSDYLGDEIVVAVPSTGTQEPLLIAEAKRPELHKYLEDQFATLRAAGQGTPLLIDNPQAALTSASRGPIVMVHGNVVAVGATQASLARVAALADRGGQGGFLSTPMWSRIAQSYQSGAGWIFAANMEQIVAQHVPKSGNVTNPANIAGLDNVKYLVIERKENLGKTQNSASLDFAGDRHGIASWLAAPGPMGTLDFVSPDASFAGSFVVKNPGTLFQELLNSAPAPAEAAQLNQIATYLGGEMTIAVDGPLLPMPSVKIAVEVNNSAGLEAALEQAAPQFGAQIAHHDVNGLTYYKMTSPKIAYEVDYVYTDGYLLAAPNEALLTSSIQNRATGSTLARSSAFRAQLPQDGHVNFSALLYYNMGAQVGPALDQLKALMTPDQQKSASMLVQNREPGLIYAYGELDRIMVASRSGFFGLGLDTLVGLNTKGAGAFTQLLPPIVRLNATRN
ncbi:MAG TPA: FecR domain-containing protein [Bryobacteraceae bacterium]|nr:FecR domain-containing protein [Bryobacteraceae bacterium]